MSAHKFSGQAPSSCWPRSMTLPYRSRMPLASDRVGQVARLLMRAINATWRVSRSACREFARRSRTSPARMLSSAVSDRRIVDATSPMGQPDWRDTGLMKRDRALSRTPRASSPTSYDLDGRAIAWTPANRRPVLLLGARPPISRGHLSLPGVVGGAGRSVRLHALTKVLGRRPPAPVGPPHPWRGAVPAGRRPVGPRRVRDHNTSQVSVVSFRCRLSVFSSHQIRQRQLTTDNLMSTSHQTSTACSPRRCCSSSPAD